MLYPVGFTKEDFSKPIIGIASTWSNVTPCNMHIDKLALEAEKGANAAGGKAIVFNTITISDGISMGTQGMKYSLVSREVIADSIETVLGCEMLDGLVAIGGCDKNMPGCLIAIARLNRPAVFVYGGTILPGCFQKRDVDIVSVFEAVGAHAAGKIGQLGGPMCALPSEPRFAAAKVAAGCRHPIDGAPQVEVAILEPQVLVRQLRRARLKRRREALVQDRELGRADFDRACG